MEKRRIIQLSKGKPKAFVRDEKEHISAIGKETVQELFLTKEGIPGDQVAHPEVLHGGPERVLCLYPFEHYAEWEKEFGKKLPPPVFGENITAAGMKEEDVCIGDIFKIGGATVQVTQGRIPCSSISVYNSIDTFLKRIVETSLSGYFFRVLEEGRISSDSTIKLVQRNAKGITVLDATKAMLHRNAGKEFLQEILKVEELAGDWRDSFEKMLQSQESGTK